MTTLIDSKEVSKILGIPLNSFKNRRKLLTHFPEPVRKGNGTSNLYSLDSVKIWCMKNCAKDLLSKTTQGAYDFIPKDISSSLDLATAHRWLRTKRIE